MFLSSASTTTIDSLLFLSARRSRTLVDPTRLGFGPAQPARWPASTGPAAALTPTGRYKYRRWSPALSLHPSQENNRAAPHLPRRLLRAPPNPAPPRRVSASPSHCSQPLFRAASSSAAFSPPSSLPLASRAVLPRSPLVSAPPAVACWTNVSFPSTRPSPCARFALPFALCSPLRPERRTPVGFVWRL